jgi:hypothetical protein
MPYLNSVQFGLKTKDRRGVARVLIVSLMLLLWLLTAALAASPDLHHLLHPDSKSATHECLVTLLSKSQLLGGGAAGCALAPVPIIFASLRIIESSPSSGVDLRLSPSRAPPVLPASITVAG